MIVLGLAVLVGGCGVIGFTGPRSGTPTAPLLVPILEPEANHQPVLAAIQDAKKSIRMEMYLLTDKDVIDSLKKAKSRGVDVRIVLEDQPEGVGTGNKPALAELASADIVVRQGNPVYQFTHSKFMIVDNRVALVTTFDHTRDGMTLNRGFGIIDQDPADVAEMSRVFEADWSGEPIQTSLPHLVWGPGDSRNRLVDFVDGSARTLDIETGTLRDDVIEQRIALAVQRGVAVRMIVSPSVNSPDPNTPARQRLAAAGVKIRMLKDPYVDTLMLVADGARGFVGSQELTQVSLDSSRELGMFITLKRIVDGLQGTFVADWDIAR